MKKILIFLIIIVCFTPLITKAAITYSTSTYYGPPYLSEFGSGNTSLDVGYLKFNEYDTLFGATAGTASPSVALILGDANNIDMIKIDGSIYLKPRDTAATQTEGYLYWSDANNAPVFYNGSSLVTCGAGTVAGSDTHIQYNNGGAFGGISGFIWDDTNVEIADDIRLALGTDADWLLSYEEADDDTCSLQSAKTASADPDIGMMTVAVDTGNSGCTADQEVFEIGKGAMDDSLANFTELFAIDEDGDCTVVHDLSVGNDLGVTGALTAGSWSITTFTTTGTTTLGNGTGTVAVNSSSWDVSTAGALSGVTTISMSGNLTISAGDVVLANGQAVKGSTTTAQTVLMQAYDVDNTTYRNVITLTNGNTIAAAIGTNYETVAVNSSDWDISTTGAMTGMGDIEISEATPTFVIKDSDASAGDDNITIVGAATDTGDGSEDVDLTISQQIAGTLRAVVTIDADGNITLGYGTQNVVSTADIVVTGYDLSLGTDGVKLTGDGDGAVTFLGMGDGADEDLTLNLDDTANKAVWSETQGIDEWILTDMGVDVDKVEVSKATPEVEFYDTDCGDGDMSAEILVAATTTTSDHEDIDVTFTQQSDGSNHNYIVSDGDGNLTLDSGAGTIVMNDNVVFTGQQTRKIKFLPKTLDLDDTAAPALGDIGTDGQCNIAVIQFDADGAGDDDTAYISWLVPDGYVDDSATLLICYTFSTAEDAADEAQFDFAIDAVAAGETLDAAGTATADQTTVISDASADNGKLHITEYDVIEKEEIDVDDIVTIKITVDVSESALAASGTLDVLYFEIEYESTE